MFVTLGPSTKRRARQPAAEQTPEEGGYRRWTGRLATAQNSQLPRGLRYSSPDSSRSAGRARGIERSPLAALPGPRFRFQSDNSVSSKARSENEKPFPKRKFNNRAAPRGSEAALSEYRGPYPHRHSPEVGLRQQQCGARVAGTLLPVLPVVLLFLLLQKEFVAGLTAGAVKRAGEPV
jgi:hypothetical protein